jgi:hypothetical protein
MTNTDNKFTLTAKLDRIDTFETKTGKKILTLILDVDGKFPQKVPVKLFGRLAEEFGTCAPGTMLAIAGRLGGREWSGKVYGDNVADTVEVVGEVAQAKGAVPSGAADDSFDPPF